MRRVGIFLVVAIALVAMVGPVSAQPKVTITGIVDNVTSYDRNMSIVDLNPARKGDKEWYARTRVRPDITAEVGTTKFVLGLEIDETWGQTGNLGKAGSCGGLGATANGGLGGGTVCSSPQRSGATAGWDLNTDTQGVIEIKWAYTEFDIPLMPVPSRMRVGAQPFEAQYKLAAYANGDFAGVHITNQWAPMIKSNFTYAQLEERITGPQDGFLRGDDFAIIASIEVTPFKGLDIRPIFSYANFISTTSSSARQARGGVGTGIANYPLMGGGFGDAVENRYTVGIDSRWRFGAFSLDPTVFYQFGKRDQVVALSFNNGLRNELKRDAWFFDIRGGWQAGPLLLELAGIYTTGNRAKDRIDRNASRLKFYEPLDTDTSFYATWAEIWALGIDYFNIFRSGATGLNPGVAIGYDKYGLIRAGVRGSYALTPAFTVRAAANSNWTTHDVDASSVLIAGTGLTQCSGLVSAAALNCDAQVRARDGNSQYLGTEVNLGFQWRFAPNVAFDMVAAYMFAGNALSTVSATNVTTGVTNNGRNPQDVQAVTARVRYSW